VATRHHLLLVWNRTWGYSALFLVYLLLELWALVWIRRVRTAGPPGAAGASWDGLRVLLSSVHTLDSCHLLAVDGGCGVNITSQAALGLGLRGLCGLLCGHGAWCWLQAIWRWSFVVVCSLAGILVSLRPETSGGYALRSPACSESPQGPASLEAWCFVGVFFRCCLAAALLGPLVVCLAYYPPC